MMNISKNKLAISGGALVATGGVAAALFLAGGGTSEAPLAQPNVSTNAPISESISEGIKPADLSSIPYKAPASEAPEALEPGGEVETPELSVPEASPSIDDFVKESQVGTPGVSSPTPTTPKAPDRVVEEAPVVRPPNAALPGEAPPIIAPPEAETPANPPFIQDNSIYLEDACVGVNAESVKKLVNRQDITASSAFIGSCSYKTPEADNDAEGTSSSFNISYLPKNATYLDTFRVNLKPDTAANGDNYYWVTLDDTYTAIVERGDYAVMVSYTSFDSEIKENARKAIVRSFAGEALTWINDLKPEPLPLFISHPELSNQPQPGHGTGLEPPASQPEQGPDGGIGDPDAKPTTPPVKPTTPPVEPPVTTPSEEPTTEPTDSETAPPADEEVAPSPSDPVAYIRYYLQKFFS